MKKIKRMLKGKSKKPYSEQVDDLGLLEGPLGIDDTKQSNGTDVRSLQTGAQPVIFSGTPNDSSARMSDVHISVVGSAPAPAVMEATAQLAPRKFGNQTDEIEEEDDDTDSLAEVSLADTEHPVVLEGGVRIHSVKGSDTVSGICIAYNVQMEPLLKLNKATRNTLLARKTIKIPPAA